jgi:HEAT repeat protein
MSEISELPFQSLIDALLDEATPFDPKYLYRLSDLDQEDLTLFLDTWPRLSLLRRRALVEDLQELGLANNLLSYKSIGQNVISDEDPHVRLLAAQILWEFEDTDLIPLFLQLLDSDPEAEIRAAAASGLGQFVFFGEIDRLHGEKLLEIEDRLLAVILNDPSVLVRNSALESIGFSSRDEVPDLIEGGFSSNDQYSKASALIAMGRSMDSRWEKNILSMLNDTLPVIREEASRAAGEIDIKDAVPTLIELTEDSEEIVRSAAIWSLSEIGGERARHTLERLFREVEDDQEADFLESALDNIAFTDGLQPFSLVDYPEESPEDDLLEMLISQEGNLDDNGNGDLNLVEDEDDEHILDNAEYDNEDQDYYD